jgi:hybrid cluster-associated redox disulfide protein
MKKALQASQPHVKIKKEMNLAEVIFKYPQLAEVLLDFGLHCVGCMANSFDTIEMGAKVHGMSDQEVDEMVDRLNEVIEHGE